MQPWSSSHFQSVNQAPILDSAGTVWSMVGLNQLIKWKLHNEWAQKIGLAKLHSNDLFSKVQLIYRFEAFIGAL